jgi:hypothetical protein
MQAGLGLPNPTQRLIADRSVGEQFSFLAKASDFVGNALFERHGLLEPAAFHGGPPFSSAL